jgi:predicted MFS family arabinose efflux permease
MTHPPLQPLRLALGGLVALAAAMGVGRFVYTPILPFMAEDLGLTKSQAGLIASANFAGYLAGALAASAQAVPGSPRTWLIGGLSASALTTGLMAVTTSITLFVVLRFIGGVASAFVLVFSSALILDRLAGAGRPDLSALHFSGVGVGIALSALFVSLLAWSGAGWRTLWIASALASFAAVVMASRLVTGGAGSQPSPVRGSRDQGTGLMALIIAYGLFGFGYVITATFLVAIVRDAPDMRPLEPYVWIVVGLTAAPCVAVWTWVGGITGVYRAFALACLIEAAGVAASVLWSGAAAALVAAALLGGTFMGIVALGLVGARRLARGDPRRTLGLATSAFGLGQIVGPLFAGLISDWTGSFVWPSLAATGALVAAAALALSIDRAS